jgi:hypothetical protein
MTAGMATGYIVQIMLNRLSVEGLRALADRISCGEVLTYDV